MFCVNCGMYGTISVYYLVDGKEKLWMEFDANGSTGNITLPQSGLIRILATVRIPCDDCCKPECGGMASEPVYQNSDAVKNVSFYVSAANQIVLGMEFRGCDCNKCD